MALSNWNKADAFKHLIPQRVEGGIIYNVLGNPVGNAGECEDMEIVPFDKLNNLSRVTAPTMTAIFNDVEKFIAACFGDEEPSVKASATVEEPVAPTGEDELPPETEEFNESVHAEFEINEALRKGKAKKAKKLLKQYKDILPKSVAKSFKKEIKEALNG